MHVSALVFGVTALVFAWRGYRKGFIGSITGVVSLLVAYPAAFFLTRPLAAVIVQYTVLDGLLVYFIAGGFVFVSATCLVSLVLNRLARPATDDAEISATSKLGGAGAGLLIGCIVGLFAVYTLNALRKPATGQSTYIAADALLDSSARRLAGFVATAAADFVFDDVATVQMTRAFVEDPQGMLGHVRQVMTNSEQVVALMSDEQVAAMVASGDVDGLLQRPDFQALVNNEHMQALMAQSGTSGEDNAQVTAEQLVSTWAKLDQVRNDPQVMAILEDPELARQLSEPGLALMTNPKLSQLAEILFAGDTPAP